MVEVKIPIQRSYHSANLMFPQKAAGLVLFAHGSGSSRLSPRNQSVARVLEKEGLATLLFDLLTSEEETADEITKELRFNIPLLAKRLIAATEWAIQQTPLPICYFGASTGAAAALVAAAETSIPIHAIVSRGGRPDLARDLLGKVKSPTLLIVGGDDFGVIELNEEAYRKLQCEKKMEIIPHASHLFEEEGKLEIVAKLSADWFLSHCQKL